jgi:hypothetical protein
MHHQYLPEGALETADWALRLNDETLLPFHGPLLYTISPVLSGLVGTKPTENSKYAVEIPCTATLDVATAFLSWLCRQELTWTLQHAKELATQQFLEHRV